jgi:hypothetical protein
VLSTGDLGWVQIPNFVVCGVLMIAFAVGMRSMDPENGFPAGTVAFAFAFTTVLAVRLRHHHGG